MHQPAKVSLSLEFLLFVCEMVVSGKPTSLSVSKASWEGVLVCVCIVGVTVQAGWLFGHLSDLLA